MYILKDETRFDLPKEITDGQYDDLIFYKKWKYKYKEKAVVLTPLSTTPNRPNSATHSTYQNRPTPNYHGNTQHHDTYSSNTNNGNSFSLIDGILATELIENIIDNSQQQQQYQDNTNLQPDQPVFNGGDTDGGGAQGSWGDPGQQQDTQQNDDLTDNFS